MRRSRALVIFGVLVAVLAVGTAKARPLAVAHAPAVPPPSSFILRQGVDAELGAGLLGHDVTFRRDHDGGAVFGSFLRPGATTWTTPAEGACGPDMVEVEGEYCPAVTQTCLRYLDPDTKLQCAEFARPTGGAAACPVKTQHKHFCIDRYEWPNRVSALPRVMASWTEAKASCESAGKRLCSDTEWTLACEGPEQHPYPYGSGYVRDDTACNIDQPYIDPDPARLFAAGTQDEELARLDQRESSGSRAACVSPYGVHDMVGNVDEWVHNESQLDKPFKRALSKAAIGGRSAPAAGR